MSAYWPHWPCCPPHAPRLASTHDPYPYWPYRKEISYLFLILATIWVYGERIGQDGQYVWPACIVHALKTLRRYHRPVYPRLASMDFRIKEWSKWSLSMRSTCVIQPLPFRLRAAAYTIEDFSS
jgi:hypothetical protein